MSIYQPLAVRAAGVAVAAMMLSSACGGAAPIQDTVDLRGKVVSEESTPVFYHITFIAQDGRERVLSIDRGVWKQAADDLDKRISEGTCIELKGTQRDVISRQMYVGPDIVEVVKC